MPDVYIIYIEEFRIQLQWKSTVRFYSLLLLYAMMGGRGGGENVDHDQNSTSYFFFKLKIEFYSHLIVKNWKEATANIGSKIHMTKRQLMAYSLHTHTNTYAMLQHIRTHERSIVVCQKCQIVWHFMRTKRFQHTIIIFCTRLNHSVIDWPLSKLSNSIATISNHKNDIYSILRPEKNLKLI